MRVLVLAGKSDLPEAHLFAGLAADGVDLRVLADPSSRFVEMWKDAGIRVVPLKIESRFDQPARGLVANELASFDPDIVHAFTNHGLAVVLPGIRKHRARLIAYRGTTGHLRIWDYGARSTYLNKRVDAISCVADAVRSYLLGCGVPPEKLVTIPKGHDPKWYESAEPVSRRELGLSPDAVVIGCVANMRKVKGVPVLLEAVATLPESPGVQVVLVGEVRDCTTRMIAHRAGLGGRVVFTGYQAGAYRLARAFDIFVMPSLDREGLPKALVEAMIQGVPPVVSDAGGLPEVVEDGVSGLLVPAGNAASLGAALSRLIGDAGLRRQLAMGARERIESKFSVKNTVEQTRRLYERLLP